MEEKFNYINNIFSDKRYDLPIRWDGKDYYSTLQSLFDAYCAEISSLWYNCDYDLSHDISKIKDGILESIGYYLNGKPHEAFDCFNENVFKVLMKNPLVANDNNVDFNKNDLQFYRARKVVENREYNIEEIFHIPFDLRNKIATSRYSIAGYPSLYLSSSVDLCLEELNVDKESNRIIVSKYDIDYTERKRVQILDLGIKPSDIINNKPIKNPVKNIRQSLLKIGMNKNSQFVRTYALWYPLIAACSYIRVNKNDPFAVEYIVPQLLMQSVRMYKNDFVTVGIRYFSCSSKRASDMGFNYVFPTKFECISNNNTTRFCQVLKTIFKLTEPVFENEYVDHRYLQLALSNSTLKKLS